MKGNSCNCQVERNKIENGLSRINFRLDDSFFLSFENSELHGGNCEVDIEMAKGIAYVKMNIKITGVVMVDCDRCLEPIDIPAFFEGVLLIKDSSEVEDMELQLDDKDEDTLLVSPLLQEIDLSQYLFDSINLALPLQRVHGEDKDGVSLCAPDMLNRFTTAPDGWDDECEDIDDELDWDALGLGDLDLDEEDDDEEDD